MPVRWYFPPQCGQDGERSQFRRIAPVGVAAGKLIKKNRSESRGLQRLWIEVVGTPFAHQHGHLQSFGGLLVAPEDQCQAVIAHQILVVGIHHNVISMGSKGLGWIPLILGMSRST